MKGFALMASFLLIIPLISAIPPAPSVYYWTTTIHFNPLPKISYPGAPAGKYILQKGGERRILFAIPKGARVSVKILPKELSKYFTFKYLKDGEIWLFEAIGDLSKLAGKNVTISLKISSNDPNPTFIPEGKLEIIREIVANPRQLVIWYAPPPSPPGYLIITSERLKDAFEVFARYKEGQGFKVYLITVQKIEKEFSGKDLPQKIRNCIRYFFDKYRISYVLLGGNFSIIPPRYFYSGDPMEKVNITPKYPPPYVPTDYYYEALEGSWDPNHNGKYLEIRNGEKLPELDYLPDVLLGRLPVNSSSQVYTYIKALSFFYSHLPYLTCWKALLLGGILEFPKNGKPGAYGSVRNWYLAHYVFRPLGIKTIMLGEQDGIAWSPVQGNGNLDDSDIYHDWENGTLFLNVVAHGYPPITVTKVWIWDNGDKIPELGEIMYRSLLSIKMLKDFKYLEKWPLIAYLSSCFAGALDWRNGSLAGALIDGGYAVAVLAATRVEYFVLNWRPGYGYNDGINYCFWYAFLRYHLPLAAAFEISRSHDMLTNSAWQNIKTALEYLVLGDPSIELPKMVPPHSFKSFYEKILGGSVWNLSGIPPKEVASGGVSIPLREVRMIYWKGSVPKLYFNGSSLTIHIFNGSAKLKVPSPKGYPYIAVRFQVLRGTSAANFSIELKGPGRSSTFSDAYIPSKRDYNRTFGSGSRYWTTGTAPHVVYFQISHNFTLAYDNGLPIGAYNGSLLNASMYLIMSGKDFSVRIYWIYFMRSQWISLKGLPGECIEIDSYLFWLKDGVVRINATRYNLLGVHDIVEFYKPSIELLAVNSTKLKLGVLTVKVLGNSISPFAASQNGSIAYVYFKGLWLYFIFPIDPSARSFSLTLYFLNGQKVHRSFSLDPNAPPPKISSLTPNKESISSAYLKIKAKISSKNPMYEVYSTVRIGNKTYVVFMRNEGGEYIGELPKPDLPPPYKVEYKITAVDSFLKVNSTRWLYFEVTDLTPPQISFKILSSNETIQTPFTGEKIKIIVFFSDNYRLQSFGARIVEKGMAFHYERISPQAGKAYITFKIPYNWSKFEIKAWALDSFGNFAERNWTIPVKDTLPPKITLLKVLGDEVTGGNLTVHVISTDNIEVQKTVLEVKYFSPEGEFIEGFEKAGGNVFFNLTIPYNCTKIFLTAISYDLSGNLAKRFLTINVSDDVLPNIQIRVIREGFFGIELKISISDNVGLKDVFINGKEYNVSSPNFSKIVSLPLARLIPQKLTVSAIDYYGNTNIQVNTYYFPSPLAYLLIIGIPLIAVLLGVLILLRRSSFLKS